MSQEDILQIQKTAATLLVDADHPDEAAAFFLEAGDWERFVPFVLSHVQALKDQGRIKTLDQWIDWLDERMGRDPSFPSLEIEADVAFAEKELNACIKFSSQAGSASLEFSVCLIKAYLLFGQQ